MPPCGLAHSCFQASSNPEVMSLKPKVLALLPKDALCARCIRVYKIRTRKYPEIPVFRCNFNDHVGLETLYCAGCHELRTRPMFSAKQAITRAEMRICIGRQGFVRLCEHEQITWDEVETKLGSLQWVCGGKPYVECLIKGLWTMVRVWMRLLCCLGS